ncbi:MAG: hypothetical protein KF898_01100 [Parachlamydiales bacterium]|nr:hypothetical protein [Candidatus Acheromyda pituitae]
MSCFRWQDMSGDKRYAIVPCDPLALHLVSPNHVLGSGPCKALSRRLRLSCVAILLYDLNRSAARALTSRPG